MNCEKNFRLRLLPVMLAALMLASAGSIGCSRSIVLYPITGQDIAVIKKGEPASINGYIMSEFYLNEVLQAKIDSK